MISGGEKMKTQEFMDLSSEQQLAWIERNVEEYEVLLYNDGYIGCSYPLEESEIAEQDMDGWLGHHGFQLDLDGGSVFTYFVSNSIGQGGASFAYMGLYASKEDMLEAVQREPFFALS